MTTWVTCLIFFFILSKHVEIIVCPTEIYLALYTGMSIQQLPAWRTEKHSWTDVEIKEIVKDVQTNQEKGMLFQGNWPVLLWGQYNLLWDCAWTWGQGTL